MTHATIIGLDLAKKNVFHAQGATHDGTQIFRKLSRGQVLAFLSEQFFEAGPQKGCMKVRNRPMRALTVLM